MRWVKVKNCNDKSSEKYEAQPYIDGCKLLNRKDNIGLDPQTFPSRNELFRTKNCWWVFAPVVVRAALIFLVEQRIKDGIVHWTVNGYKEKIYKFNFSNIRMRSSIWNVRRYVLMKRYYKTNIFYSAPFADMDDFGNFASVTRIRKITC